MVTGRIESCITASSGACVAFNEIVTDKVKKVSTRVILNLNYDGRTKYILNSSNEVVKTCA